MGRRKGKLTEEWVLKEILNTINETISKDQKFYKKFANIIKSNIQKLQLKDYDFSDASHILDIPIPVIKDNYDRLSKFVMELPQKIVDENDNINGFIIVIDEFQLLKMLKSLMLSFG